MKNIKQQLNFVLIAGMLVFISCNNDGNNRSPGTDTTITGNVGETREEDFVRCSGNECKRNCLVKYRDQQRHG